MRKAVEPRNFRNCSSKMLRHQPTDAVSIGQVLIYTFFVWLSWSEYAAGLTALATAVENSKFYEEECAKHANPSECEHLRPSIKKKRLKFLKILCCRSPLTRLQVLCMSPA